MAPSADDFPCLLSATCTGLPPGNNNGSCIYRYYGERYTSPKVCRDETATNPCAVAVACDGRFGACPPVLETEPAITEGVLELFTRDPSGALTSLPAGADGGSPDTTLLPVGFPGWSVACGSLAFSAAVYTTAPGDSTCTPGPSVVWSTYVTFDASGVPVVLVPVNDPAYRRGALLRVVGRVKNRKDLTRMACISAPIVLDDTAPVATAAAVVNIDPTTGVEGVTYHPGRGLKVAWSGFSEDSWSTWAGTLSYSVMVRYRPLSSPQSAGYQDLLLTPSGTVLIVGRAGQSGTADILPSDPAGPAFPDAAEYIVYVRATNRAGLESDW